MCYSDTRVIEGNFKTLISGVRPTSSIVCRYFFSFIGQSFKVFDI